MGVWDFTPDRVDVFEQKIGRCEIPHTHYPVQKESDILEEQSVLHCHVHCCVPGVRAA